MIEHITHFYATGLFLIGLLGLLRSRTQLLMLLMSLELMLLAVNTNFIGFSVKQGDIAGQIMVFFILTVAAAEVAIGLALLVILFRKKNSVDLEAITELRG
jgi:NADH-quinone oxidoreductase subunit K